MTDYRPLHDPGTQEAMTQHVRDRQPVVDEQERAAWVIVARVRDVIDTMDGITGARHWARILRKVVDGEEPPAPAATGATGHVYLSTGCLHDRHDYCSNVDGLAGRKTPAQCKFCAAPCTCPCHAGPGPAGTEETEPREQPPGPDARPA